MKPQVTILSTSPQSVGGTERMAQVLAATLLKQGVGVRFFIPDTPRAPEVAGAARRWHREQGAPAEIDARFSRDNLGWRNVRGLAAVLRRCPGRMVNLHYAETTSVSLTDVLAVRLAGKRCVLTVQHPTPWDRVSPLGQKIIALALRLAEQVVVSTEFTRKMVCELLPDSARVVVIPCGTPPPESTWTRAAARQELGLPPDAFVVSSLARLDSYKGIDDTIRALASLPDRDNRLRYVVAGDGTSRADYERLAQEQMPGRVVFLGKVADADVVYAASDVFSLPSHWEGFGVVYVEAAFAELPSIGCAVAGSPYVIAEGRTGLLVPPGDPPALARALERLRQDAPLRHTLGAQAQARAYAEFTDTAMAERYRAVFFGSN